MATSASEHNRQKRFRDYEKFRRSYPKIDIEFLDQPSRRQRICESAEELESFLQGFLEIADKAKESNTDCYMILDTNYIFLFQEMGISWVAPHWRRKTL